MSFEKLFYKGKEIKPKEPKLVAFELTMPKKSKGLKPILINFSLSFEHGKKIRITVDNDSRIKKIVVYTKPR